MFNKSQLFFIYKTKSVNLFQEMTLWSLKVPLVSLVSNVRAYLSVTHRLTSGVLGVVKAASVSPTHVVVMREGSMPLVVR